ncbi:hypothetical protein [Nocardioides psychrotolerans]|uniref:hypothetical protein n=1 Tax=Nocardioides psychrotolerans TaxID=1005945 RepID=UPI001160897E|nr:hypothetical protein [Nocardioides psychrotolerans]
MTAAIAHEVPFRISELIVVRASGAVTGALSKPSGTPAAGGTGDLPLEGGDAEGDDESEEAPAVIGSPGFLTTAKERSA